MPRVAIAVVLIVIVVGSWEITASASHPIPEVSVYDPNPSHIWNRLYAALLVRQDANGESFNANSLDPPLRAFSRHLLERKSHRYAVRVLDEFLETHAENLTRDPVKRALFTRDLWAVFDWSVARVPMNPREPTYDAEKRELQARLAEMLHRLALTTREIEALPDNYAQAVASGAFPKEYDPAHPDRAFLPPDLFDHHGPWVPIQGNGKPVAEQHVSFFSGRSRFLIFIRLPGGRKAAYDYFRQLWEYPQLAPAGDASEPAEFSLLLRSFPAGTQVALVRQMTTFDDQGNLRAAPITESVQIRVYRTVTRSNNAPAGLSAAVEASGQRFHEIRLDRALLFAGRTGGLREVGRDDKELFMFNAVPFDELDNPKSRVDWATVTPIMQECVWCHRRPGIDSLNSRAALLKPNPLQHDASYESPARLWAQDGTIPWKKSRDDWGLLNGYWKHARPR